MADSRRGYWKDDIDNSPVWSLDQSQWVLENRGEGVWPFIEQPDIWGYLNNPRWVSTPSDPVNYTGNEANEPQIFTPEGDDADE